MFCAESREPLCRITCAPSATMCFQNLDFLRSSFSRSAPRNMFSPRRSHLVVSKRTFSMLFPPVNLQKRIMFLTVDFSARVSCMSCMYISAESRFPSSYDTRSHSARRSSIVPSSRSVSSKPGVSTSTIRRPSMVHSTSRTCSVSRILCQ